MRGLNLIGVRFGKLLVLERTDKRTKKGGILSKCLCDCGQTTEAATDKLRAGQKRSCGCSRLGNYPVMYGDKNPAWRGGRRISRQGYVDIKMRSHPRANYEGYVLEHRLVMEEKLGRYLTPKEVVHHIDGNRVNNTPENLHLFPNGSAHVRWHRRLNEIALYD